MASKDAVLDIDEVSLRSPQDELMFQEIPHTHGIKQTVQTHVFTNFPQQDDSDSDDKTELLEEGKPKCQKSFFSFSYYQSFFDVDAKQVLGRILGSFYPSPKVNYLQTHIRPKPDLYGPFWVSTTLIMSIAMAGNLINYFSSSGSPVGFKWKFDFHKVTIATATIYTYWLLMPLSVYLFLRWRGNREAYQISELACLYGYSLSIYIPVSVLCLIPVYWLQWLFVLISMVMSGIVLVFAIWPAVKNDKKQVAVMLIAAVVLMHCVLAIGFMLYFFSPSTTLPSGPPASTTYTVLTSKVSIPPSKTTPMATPTSSKAFSMSSGPMAFTTYP